MVTDLNDTYKMMMMMIMMTRTIKIQNCHNSANFEATTFIFCMVIDISNTYRIYFLAKSYFANKLMCTHLAYLFSHSFYVNFDDTFKHL